MPVPVRRTRPTILEPSLNRPDFSTAAPGALPFRAAGIHIAGADADSCRAGAHGV